LPLRPAKGNVRRAAGVRRPQCEGDCSGARRKGCSL